MDLAIRATVDATIVNRIARRTGVKTLVDLGIGQPCKCSIFRGIERGAEQD